MKACRSVCGPTRLVIAACRGDATHNASGGMTVESLPGAVYEDRALDSLTDREVEYPGDPRRQRHRNDLAALAVHCQGPVTAFQAQRVDVGAEGFGDSQPVQRQQ